MDEVYTEFRLSREQVEAVVTAEVSRCHDSKIRDFVPVFAAQRVRTQLRGLH